MSQVLLQFAIQTLCPPQTMKFKNNFIGKTKLHHSLSVSLCSGRGRGQNKAKASSLNTANMKYLPRK